MTGSSMPWPAAHRAGYDAATPLTPVELELEIAGGHALAGTLWSLAPLPPFDMAAMDGFAVRGTDPWRVVGRVLAGDSPPAPLHDGEAVEIATGACVPDGCDGVLPYEQSAVLGEMVTGPAPRGGHVRRAGEECAARTAVLAAGQVLSPAALGLAAAVGHDRALVHPIPRVATIVTGAELLAAGMPGDGRIRDAVGPLLSGAVAAYGGLLVERQLLGDEPTALRAAIESADADVVITSGASAAGRADYLVQVLHELDAALVVDGVAVRPGHPQVLAQLSDGRWIVGLPGNPLAALAALATLVLPLLARLGGRAFPEPSCASLTKAIPAAAHNDHRLVPVQLVRNLAHPTGHAGAAMLRGAAVANALAVIAPDTVREVGDSVDLLALP